MIYFYIGSMIIGLIIGGTIALLLTANILSRSNDNGNSKGTPQDFDTDVNIIPLSDAQYSSRLYDGTVGFHFKDYKR